MYKVLVTGGVGSGKSTACKLFGELGIPIYYSDVEAKKLMVNDDRIVNSIKNMFGKDIYSGKELQRNKLAEIVFNDRSKLDELDEIVHPIVAENFEKWCEAQILFDAPYVIEEAAIAIELGIQDRFDHIIVVTADEELRIERVMKRNNCTREQVLDRIKNQLPDEDKIKHADSIINNSDFPNLECQVKGVHKKILEFIEK